MRLIVTGSRSICEYTRVSHVLNDVLASLLVQGRTVDELVEGESRGVDLLAKQWADKMGIPVKPFPADWSTLEGVPLSRIRVNSTGRQYNVAAGYERNQKMLNYASTEDLVVAIWDGESAGTRDLIEKAKKKGVKVSISIVE